MDKKEKEFIEKLEQEELIIKKVIQYPFRVYFTLGNERYLYGNGFGELYEQYSMLALVDREKRKVLRVIAEDMIFPIDYLFLKNGEKFNTQKGMTYSYINTNRFKIDLANYLLPKREKNNEAI